MILVAKVKVKETYYTVLNVDVDILMDLSID